MKLIFNLSLVSILAKFFIRIKNIYVRVNPIHAATNAMTTQIEQCGNPIINSPI